MVAHHIRVCWCKMTRFVGPNANTEIQRLVMFGAYTYRIPAAYNCMYASAMPNINVLQEA